MAKMQRPQPNGYLKYEGPYEITRLTKAGMSTMGARQVLSGQPLTVAKDRQIIAAAVKSLIADEAGQPKGWSFGCSSPWD